MSLLVKVLERNRTNRIYTDIFIRGDFFFTGIGSHDYGGCEIPLSVVCKLENQESY